MTTYAEIYGSTLIQYPYNFASLSAENPFTNYDGNVDFVDIFPNTNTAVQKGYTLAPVTILAQPAFNPLTQSCTQNAAPTLVGEVWTLGWTVAALSSAQLAVNAAAQVAAQAPIVAASYAAKLQRNATALAAKGQTWQAVQLLLQAQGINV